MPAASMNKEEKGKFSLKRIASKIGRPFRDMKGEMKKVVWPTRKQVINNTLIVIVLVLIMAVLLGGLDVILTALVNLFLKG